MKKLTLFSVFCFIVISVFAQAPQSFNYQLIARDTSGKVLANSTLGIQISILKDSNTGIVVYSERHISTTNNYGLSSLAIGNGIIVSGNFLPINWGTHLHFIKLEIDPAGGTNYFTMGISQLMSVPYALYAEKAGNVVDTSNTNELQALSISNDTIYLSNGGHVKLPTNVSSVWSSNGDNIYNSNIGFVGIGTDNPTSALHVNGSVRITDESEGTGKVLTSDDSGNASWQAPSSGNVAGTTNYVPKFTGTNSIGNSMVYETNNKMGIGTKTPTGRVVIKGDSLANDSLPLLEVQDKNGNTVFVVWPDGVHVYVNDTSASKAQNKGSFAVSGKSSAKVATDEVFVVKPNDVHIYLDENGAGKANNKGSFAVSGKSTAKGVTNDYLSVNSDSIKASKSLYIPRMTSLERDSLSFTPSEALIIFNTTDKCMQIYENNVWSNIWCFHCVPSIIYQSPDVSRCPDNNANISLSITATGTSLNYQWQISSDSGTTWNNIIDGGVNPFYSGVNRPELIISNVPNNLNGFQYKCTVSGSCSPSVESDPILVSISSNQFITSQPNNKAVLLGQNTIFSIVASGDFTFQWRESSDNGATWINVTDGGTNPVCSGSNTTSLSLANIPVNYNGRKYTCVVNSDCGIDVSVIVTLSVLECGGTFTDIRDNQSYNTVLLNNQCWMAQNLNVGSVILGNTTPTDNQIIEKYCPSDIAANCNTYGGLYTWYEMMGYYDFNHPENFPQGISQGICPVGWHIPRDEDWSALITSLGGETVAGGKLKETGTTHWLSPNEGANNISGFTALPAGVRGVNGIVGGFRTNAAFWSSTWFIDYYAVQHAWFYWVSYTSAGSARSEGDWFSGYSVRCIMDL